MIAQQNNINDIFFCFFAFSKEQKTNTLLYSKTDSLTKIMKEILLSKEALSISFQKNTFIFLDIYADFCALLMEKPELLAQVRVIDSVVRENLNIDFFKKDNQYLNTTFISNLGFASKILNKVLKNSEKIELIISKNYKLELLNDLFIYSTKIQFSIVSAMVIETQNIKLDEAKMNELAQFTAESAQKYGALAMQLGIIEKRIATHQFTSQNITPDDIENEQNLAEQGIAEYSQTLKDYEV